MGNFITNIFSNICLNIENLLNTNILYLIVFFIIMTVATITDITKLKIYNWFNFGALFIRLIFAIIHPIAVMDIFGAIILFILMFIIGFININNKIGGDIKYTPVFALWAGSYLACASFLLATIIMFPVSLIRKGKATPLAPFLQLGLIIITVIIFLTTNVAVG